MTELVTTGGAPVMLGPEQGRIVTGGPVHARVLVAHDHPSYASTFEVIIAPGFDVGVHVHTNGEEMFYVIHGHIDVFCFEPVDRSVGDWRQWASPTGQTYLRGGPGAFMYVPPDFGHSG